MRVTGKVYREITDGIRQAVWEVLEKKCPSHKTRVPSCFPENERILWDAITDVECKIIAKVSTILATKPM